MAETKRLRVLVCDGPGVRLDEVTMTISGLGHEVIARESSLPDVARITATEHPDVAIVIVHDGTAKALELIDEIVHNATCPVIARRPGPRVHQRSCEARDLRLRGGRPW